MSRIKHGIFIMAIFMQVFPLFTQETYFINQDGTFVYSEENTPVKYIVGNIDKDLFVLCNAMKGSEEWSKTEFLQIVRKVSDRVYHITAGRNF